MRARAFMAEEEGARNMDASQGKSVGSIPKAEPLPPASSLPDVALFQDLDSLDRAPPSFFEDCPLCDGCAALRYRVGLV